MVCCYHETGLKPGLVVSDKNNNYLWTRIWHWSFAIIFVNVTQTFCNHCTPVVFWFSFKFWKSDWHKICKTKEAILNYLNWHPAPTSCHFLLKVTFFFTLFGHFLALLSIFLLNIFVHWQIIFESLTKLLEFLSFVFSKNFLHPFASRSGIKEN